MNQLPPPPPQINIRRTKSAVNVNIIATGVVFLTLFGMCAILSFRESLAVAILWTGRALAVGISGWVVVKLASGAVGVWHKAKTYSLEQQEKAMALQVQRAQLWQHNFIDIGTNGTIAHNPLNGDYRYIPALKSSKAPEAVDSPAMLPEPERREMLLDLMPYAEHWLMVGSTQSGKTTAMIHLALAYQRQGARVTALDIHASKNPWPFPAVGRGRDFEAVAASLAATHDALNKRSGTGQDSPALVVVVDEWPAVVDGCLDAGHDVRRYLRELVREGAKFGITIILAAHGDGVEDLGTQGRKSVRDNFQIVYFSHRWKSRNEAAIGSIREPEFIDLPGPYHAPRMLTEEERIEAAYEPGKSLRAICREAGLSEGGRALERVKVVLSKRISP